MSSLIRPTITAFVAPLHKLAVPRGTWERGAAELARRGQGRRESGAFILGSHRGGRRHADRFVFYDDLDPHCLDSGIVVFDGAVGFPKLWAICRQTDLDVVADVHTHGGLGAARQSGIDERNPMIARRGHIALVVPNLAQGHERTTDIGKHVYAGNFKWKDHSSDEHFLYVGLFA
jgi:hypothetical protein